MGNKNKIGALVILGGIAVLGYVYFKKTKPTVATSQLKGLKAVSDYYKAGYGGQEETLLQGTAYVPLKSGEIVIGGVPQSIYANVDYTKMTPKEKADLKASIGEIYDPKTAILNQIAENMKNADFTNLDLGIKPDFSKLNKVFL